MLKKEDRLDVKYDVTNKSKCIKYLHLCKGCKKEMWKTATYEKTSSGYCISCVSKNHKFIYTENDKNERKCKTCKLYLPIDNFLKSKRINRYSGICIKCSNLKRFKITALDYDIMLTKQRDCCAICSEKETKFYKGKRKRLSVDHCHKSGKVRGLLCSRCNMAIGLFKDNESALRKAIIYLKRNK